MFSGNPGQVQAVGRERGMQSTHSNAEGSSSVIGSEIRKFLEGKKEKGKEMSA